MARLTLVTVSIMFLLTDEPLGPSGAPCGLDPGCYPPPPAPRSSFFYTGCPQGA